MYDADILNQSIGVKIKKATNKGNCIVKHIICYARKRNEDVNVYIIRKCWPLV